MDNRYAVPMFSLNPLVHSAPERVCVGGPADGQSMQVAPSHVLIVAFDRVAGHRAVSLPPEHIKLAKDLGTYAGHYEVNGDELHWIAPDADPSEVR